jgi:HSP20 family molecular chaperone IbpA
MQFSTNYNPVDDIFGRNEFLLGTSLDPMLRTGPISSTMPDQDVASKCIPSMDVLVSDDYYCYFFDLPGVNSKDDIELNIENNVLSIKAQKPRRCA